MTLTIEVDDDKAITLLKQLEELKILKFKSSIKEDTALGISVEHNSKSETFGPKQQSELMALSGSLNMSPERFKEYEVFLQEIRNEWE